jgi:hypothetical protein
LKTRIVHTKFWNDSFILSLNPTEKLLFIYLLTNEQVNIIHLYECPDEKILFDTGIDRGILQKAKDKFEKAGKIYFKDGFIYLKNSYKYEKYVGEKNDLAKQNLYNQLNGSILKWHRGIDRGIDTPRIGTINHNTEIRNHKSKIINHKSKDITIKKNKKPEEVKEILNYFKEVYKIKNLPNQLVQLGCAEWLFKEKGLEKAKQAILASYKCRGQEFAPSINNLMDLRDKYGKLEEFYYRLKRKEQDGKKRIVEI